MKIRLALPIVFAFAFPNFVMPVQAQLVPGSGQQIKEVFDDFEDPNWNFTLNLPKSSANIDKVERHPSGFSDNRLYLESMYRGTPDFVKRVETPPGGLRGSNGALAMQTLHSGTPGHLSHTFQQDDLIAGVQQKLGYMMPVGWSPSYVCRVYIPPFDKWERRHGSHFGFRADCTTTITKTSTVGKFFKSVGSHKALEQYWPGFFIQLNLKEMTREKEDYAQILIRSDTLGHDVPGPKVTKPGWWTLGLSFTPDGKVHYYGHEGVADLTSRDHLYSNFPYGYHCEQTSTFFFNIVNQDDGRSWSTRWIVDDPKVYVASGTYRPPVQQVAQQPAAPVVQQQQAQQQQQQSLAAQIPAAPPAAPSSVQAKAALQTQAPVAQPKAAAYQLQGPGVQSQLPATQPGAAVQQSTQSPTAAPPAKSQTTTIPAAAATQLKTNAAPIPLLASKPSEIPTSPPKLENVTENPGPTPAPVQPTITEPVKPAPSAPVIDETPATTKPE